MINPAQIRFSTKAPKRNMELHHAYEMLTKYRRELKKLILSDMRLEEHTKRSMYNEVYRLDKWIYNAEQDLKIRFEVNAGEWEFTNGY